MLRATQRPNKAEAGHAEEMIKHGRVADVLTEPRLAKTLTPARMGDLKQQMADAEAGLARFASAKWGKPKGSEGGMQLWYYCEGSVHHFKALATFDSQPTALLAILREWDLVPRWNKYVPQAIIVTEPSLMSLRGGGELYLPPPFANRSCMFDAEGVDLLDTHGLWYCGFASTPESLAAMPRELSKFEHLLFGASGFTITPMSSAGAGARDSGRASAAGEAAVADRCECAFVVAIDVKQLKIPTWLVDLILTVIAPFVYSQVAKLLKSITGEYKARMEMRSELYGPLQAHADAHVSVERGVRRNASGGSSSHGRKPAQRARFF